MKNKLFDDEILFHKNNSYIENHFIKKNEYDKINKIYSKEVIINNNVYLLRNNVVRHYYLENENNDNEYKENDKNNVSYLYRMVNKDALISYNKRNIKNIDIKNYYYSFFNLENLIKNKNNNNVIGVDINSCYWTTAKNLGIISESTYIYGLENCSKRLRNSTIGSFNSNVIINNYGINVIENSIIQKRKISVLRNEIIYYVYKIAYNIQRILKNDFLFFYVDCFYINNNDTALNKLFTYLTKNNYQYKIKNCELFDIEYNNNNIVMNWKNSKGKTVKNYFNKNQNIL